MLGRDVTLYAVRKQRGQVKKRGRESVLPCLNTVKGRGKKHLSFGNVPRWDSMHRRFILLVVVFEDYNALAD